MINFKQPISFANANDLKIDYSRYPKYNTIKVKSPMKKWLIEVDPNNKETIISVKSIYREKYGDVKNYRKDFKAPRRDIMSVLRYISHSDYHIPKYSVNDKASIKRYASQFKFNVSFLDDNTIILKHRNIKWKIEHNGTKVIGLYEGINDNEWMYHSAPKRNISATIFYCYKYGRNKLRKNYISN